MTPVERGVFVATSAGFCLALVALLAQAPPRCKPGSFVVDRIEHTENEVGAGGWVVLEGPTPAPDSLGVYPMYDVPAALLPYAQAGDSLALCSTWVFEVSQ